MVATGGQTAEAAVVGVVVVARGGKWSGGDQKGDKGKERERWLGKKGKRRGEARGQECAWNRARSIGRVSRQSEHGKRRVVETRKRKKWGERGASVKNNEEWPQRQEMVARKERSGYLSG